MLRAVYRRSSLRTAILVVGTAAAALAVSSVTEALPTPQAGASDAAAPIQPAECYTLARGRTKWRLEFQRLGCKRALAIVNELAGKTVPASRIYPIRPDGMWCDGRPQGKKPSLITCSGGPKRSSLRAGIVEMYIHGTVVRRRLPTQAPCGSLTDDLGRTWEVRVERMACAEPLRVVRIAAVKEDMDRYVGAELNMDCTSGPPSGLPRYLSCFRAAPSGAGPWDGPGSSQFSATVVSSATATGTRTRP